MKSVHLINVRWFNATAWYALRLAESAIIQGEQAAIAGLPDSPVIRMAKEMGIPTLEAPFTSNKPIDFFNNLRSLNKFIKEQEADTLVCHRGEMFWIIALNKFFSKKNYKLIRVRGDVRPPTKDIFSKFFHNTCTDHIVTSANFIRDYFLNNLKSKPNHVSTIYGGVNREIFKENIDARNKIRNEYNFSDDDFVVGVVGRFDPVKGHSIFLKACGLAYKNGMTNLKIILAGFPENIKVHEIETIIEENGLKDITIITGKVSNINEIINGFDLGVISSLGSEAICRVAMEFMSSNIPVISSNAGVLPEMLPEEFRYEIEDYNRLSKLIMNKKGFIKIYDQKDFYNEFKKEIGY